ncbi:MAG: T9SS type A sorting domain-containing protein [Bacteroidia bacterium]|nr:T9SS type A sorting domain-containing protein [Bacteroidia bacterium]
MKQTLYTFIVLLFSASGPVWAQFNPNPLSGTPLQKAQLIALTNGTYTELVQSWNGSYQNSSKRTVSTDAHGNLLLNNSWYFMSGNWVTQSWQNGTTTYNGSGKEQTIWSKGTSVDTAHFAVKWIYQIGYDGSGKMIYYNHADSFYTGTTLDQTTVQVDSFYYNTAGKITRIDTYTKGTSGNYTLNWTAKITYDANNNPTDYDYALTANNDYAVASRAKFTWDAQNRMTSFRSFPAYMYLTYKDSVYEQKSQYFYYDGSGNLSMVVDSQYSGTGLLPFATYRNFLFSSGNLMRYSSENIQYGFTDSVLYYRSATGFPDSIQYYRSIGSGFNYIGHVLYTTQPNTPTAIATVTNTLPTTHSYPNPATETITVVSGVSGSYQLLTLMGTEVLSGKLEEGKTDLNVAPVKRGLYLLVSETNGQVSVQKILLQ